MSPDELQRTWQSQESGTRLHVDADLLLKEVRRNQRSFLATIFWRDFREVAVAVGLAVLFLAWALRGDGWPSWLLAAAAVWVGGFILVDRFRQRGGSAAFRESLLGCVEASLRQVEHQIWLLKNVFWWYLLPLAVGLSASIIHHAVSDVGPSWLRGVVFLLQSAICAAVFVGVYWLNQLAVRSHLEPRRQELLAVRESLTGAEE